MRATYTPLPAVAAITSMAMRPVLEALVAVYERASGQGTMLEAAGGVDVARRIVAGERFDVVVLASDAIDKLAAGGHVVAASQRALARSGIAVAVHADAPTPDVSTEAALRDAVLAAHRIGYSTGPSGRHLLQLLERWGIADTVAPRLLEARPGTPVGALVAQGIVTMGFQQASELAGVPGIRMAGALPAGIQAITTFAGAVGAHSAHADAAGAWLAWLASPACDAVKRQHAMEPPLRA